MTYAPPTGFELYTGPCDWRFLPGAWFMSEKQRAWAQIEHNGQRGAFATPYGIYAIPS